MGDKKGEGKHTQTSSLEGAMKVKFVPFCSSRGALSVGILFGQTQNFQILAENHGLYIVHGFIFVDPKKVLRKVYHLNGSEKRNLMALVSVA